MWFFVGALLLTGAHCYTPTVPSASSQQGSGVKYAWSKVDFKYADPNKRAQDLSSGRLQPDSIIILDADAYKGPDGTKREFVTTPALMEGVPFTLSEVTNKRWEGGPELRPFPNEYWHQKGNCDSIISPFRIKIDKKGRMWVLDTGKVNVFVKGEKVCDPQLLAFDLNRNNSLIRRYRIPKDQFDDRSLPVNLEVEVGSDDTWVYMADPVTFKVVVYSLKKDSSHAVSHPYFYPDPLYGYYSLNGANFTLMDGVLSLALGNPKTPKGPTKLYFHSLSSGREGVVTTDVLREPAGSVARANEFRLSAKDRMSHVSIEVVTRNDIMIFANLEDNALYAWDTNMPYNGKNFRLLVKNREALQFVSGMKLVGDELYVLSSRLQNILAGRHEKGKINYRLLVYKVDKLLARHSA